MPSPQQIPQTYRLCLIGQTTGCIFVFKNNLDPASLRLCLQDLSQMACLPDLNIPNCIYCWTCFKPSSTGRPKRRAGSSHDQNLYEGLVACSRCPLTCHASCYKFGTDQEVRAACNCAAAAAAEAFLLARSAHCRTGQKHASAFLTSVRTVCFAPMCVAGG
jgi:hypothetical protein